MRLKSVSLAAAAIALSTASISAQAAQADRQVAPVSSESELGGGEGSTQLIFLAIVAAIIFAAIELTNDDDPLSV